MLSKDLIKSKLHIDDEATIDYLLMILGDAISEQESTTTSADFNALHELIQPFMGAESSATIIDEFLNSIGIHKSPQPSKTTTKSPSKIKAPSPAKTKGTLADQMDAMQLQQDANANEISSSSTKSKKRLGKPKDAATTTTTNKDDDLKELDEFDDYSSMWEQRRSQGRLWGGRGAGGRGVKFTNSDMTDSLSLHNVSLAYAGKVLLEPCTIQLVRGRRYALIGENGVGKTTLLRSMAVGRIPGWPTSLACYYVRQDAVGSSETAINLVMKEAINEEDHLSDVDDEDEETAQTKKVVKTDAEKLARARKEAETLLLTLGFKKSMMDLPTTQLSGGFRMRVSLAQALMAKPDLLLLDEPDAHLDLVALKQLESLLVPDFDSDAKTIAHHNTLIIISHDREFLDNVATDVIEFAQKKLTFFPSGYADYIQRQEEKRDATIRRFAAAEKQKQKAMQFIQTQSSGKNRLDEKKQKQVKQKANKLDRIGYFREDGHRYKTRSLATLDEDALRLPEIPLPPSRDPNLKFNFPDPAELGGAPNAPLIVLDEVSVGYVSAGSAGKGKPILSNVTLQVRPSSKIAIMGRNGEGKSTLMKLLLDDGSDPTLSVLGGTVSRKSGLKIAYVGQHSADILQPHLDKTSVQVLMELQRGCDTVEKARSHLGGLGISGNTALIVVSKLSGGQKTRLLLALALWGHPQILMLDEPTNGLSVSAIQALEHGLREFNGAFIVISHDRALLKNCARELWLVGNGTLQIAIHDDYHLRKLRSGGGVAAATAANASDSEDEEEIEFRDNFKDKFDEGVNLLLRGGIVTAGGGSGSSTGKGGAGKAGQKQSQVGANRMR